MPSKKHTTKKSKQRKTTVYASRVWHGDETENIGIMLGGDDELLLPLSSRTNGARKQPYRINPETDEEREKRLAARKALTLKAARIAYENHQLSELPDNFLFSSIVLMELKDERRD